MKTLGSIWKSLIIVTVFLTSVGCTITQNLEISRHNSATLNNADADQILGDMSTIIQTNDGEGDVACPVRFRRSGDVNTFNEGNGTINNGTEFNNVNQLDGHVKIVNQINWCGNINPSFIGCAPVPGTSFIAERFTADMEGILWAHEFGHNKGLGHRNETFALMRGIINVNNRRITCWECDAFKNTGAGIVPVAEITNVSFTPSSPTVLDIGDQVSFTFNYETNREGGVRIFGRPFTAGEPTPNYAAHPSQVHPEGSGSVSGFFLINSAENVDQVRFQMWDADQNCLLFETFIPVNYTYE
jgi:hypothetical protein